MAYHSPAAQALAAQERRTLTALEATLENLQEAEARGEDEEALALAADLETLQDTLSTIHEERRARGL